MENLLISPKRKMTIEEALAIREDYKAGLFWSELVQKYNRSKSLLLQIIKGTHYLLRDPK